MKASINGIELAYVDQGRGYPILFLHAFPLNQHMWEPQKRVLAERYRVITMDLRGHGDTDAPLWRYTMEQFADDVKGLLDHLKLSEPVLCGLSMGGYVALAFYRRHGDRVRGLVLADTRAGVDTVDAKAGRYAMAQKAYREGLGTVEDAMLPRLLSKEALTTRPALVAQVREMIRGTSVSGIAGALMAMTDREDAIPLLRAIVCPTLVIVGELDQPTPPAEARIMAELIPGARLVILPDAGHLANLEQPETFNQALLEFLDDVGRNG
jgi:3-oxoadipate enol-lactonase